VLLYTFATSLNLFEKIKATGIVILAHLAKLGRMGGWSPFSISINRLLAVPQPTLCQAPEFKQNFNWFSYCLNNPLIILSSGVLFLFTSAFSDALLLGHCSDWVVFNHRY
jgi:hypothetical protein